MKSYSIRRHRVETRRMLLVQSGDDECREPRAVRDQATPGMKVRHKHSPAWTSDSPAASATLTRRSVTGTARVVTLAGCLLRPGQIRIVSPSGDHATPNQASSAIGRADDPSRGVVKTSPFKMNAMD